MPRPISCTNSSPATTLCSSATALFAAADHILSQIVLHFQHIDSSRTSPSAAPSAVRRSLWKLTTHHDTWPMTVRAQGVPSECGAARSRAPSDLGRAMCQRGLLSDREHPPRGERDSADEAADSACGGDRSGSSLLPAWRGAKPGLSRAFVERSQAREPSAPGLLESVEGRELLLSSQG